MRKLEDLTFTLVISVITVVVTVWFTFLPAVGLLYMLGLLR